MTSFKQPGSQLQVQTNSSLYIFALLAVNTVDTDAETLQAIDGLPTNYHFKLQILVGHLVNHSPSNTPLSGAPVTMEAISPKTSCTTGVAASASSLVP